MASPVSSRAAAAPMQRRNQRERRARSLPTRNATNADSITKYRGFLPWITACATEPFCTRQMIHTAIAAAAAVSAAAPAFSASRHTLRTRTKRTRPANRKQPMPTPTAASEDSQRGMCSSARETSLESSVLPSGRARIEPTTTRTTASDSTPNSRSVGRRTRSSPGETRGGEVTSRACSRLTAFRPGSSAPPLRLSCSGRLPGLTFGIPGNDRAYVFSTIIYLAVWLAVQRVAPAARRRRSA